MSAEVREDPSLRGLPVVVGADPEGGKGRGVVVACSYEARKFGLRSGMPISRAYRLCPGARYLAPHWALYEKTSVEVMETLKGFADRFEQASIDEAFLDVTSRAADETAAKEVASAVKEAVRRRHSLTCSIGIGPNKSSAKIASDMQKPDGLTVVPFGRVEEFLSQLPVTVVPGIGGKTQEFLKQKGIEHIGQLQKLDGRRLMGWFGKNGVWLWGVVHGQESVEVRQQELPKSLSVERTFGEDIADFQSVRKEARSACSELARRVSESGLEFRVGGIKIRFRGFETHTREKTIPTHTDDEGALWQIVDSLLAEFEHDRRPVRLIGVRVAGLTRATAAPTRLDAWAQGS